MMKLLLLTTLACAVLGLAGALFFLYRYLVRSRLFPQLPRIWKGDRRRFVFFSLGFVVCLAGFVVLVWLTGQPPAAPPSPPAPPPGAMAPASPAPPPAERAAGEERVLPPLSGEGGPRPPAEPLPAVAPGSELPGGTAPAPDMPAAQPPASASTLSTTSSTSSTASTTSSATTTTSPAAPVQAQAPEKRYWVVMGSHASEAGAKAQQASLANRGVTAQIWFVDLKQKGRWYRVCAGDFEGYTQARDQGLAWKKAGLTPDPFVVNKP